MAALALTTTPVRGGTVVTPGNVAASDTISATLLGSRGCYLKIINGNASTDNMTISDASTTATGAAAAALAPSVATTVSRIFAIDPRMADPTTGLVTITHSVTTTVTYELYPR